MTIMLVYSPAARQVREWALVLPAGSTVGQAVEQSGILTACPELASNPLVLGIWGRKATLMHVLHACDRLEVYRPLRVDPKIARRERFDQQGVKKSGLFAQRRSGAKAGY